MRGGIVGISLGRDVCTDSDSGASTQLFSEEGDGVADSDFTVVSLTGAVVLLLFVVVELEVVISGVLGVLGVLGVWLPPSDSEGSFVLSSLLESSSNTDFLPFRSF